MSQKSMPETEKLDLSFLDFPQEESPFEEQLDNSRSEQENSIESLQKMAEDSEAKGQWETAIDRYQKILEIQPNNVAARIKLANAFQELNKIEEAIAYYQNAIAINPNLPFRVYLNLGDALYEKEQLDEAIAAYQHASQLQPNLPFRYYQILSELLVKTERLEEAMVYYQKAVELKPNSQGLYLNLAKIAGKISDFDVAIASYKKAIELKQNTPFWVYKNLGDALENKGRLDEAIASYQKALELKPDLFWGYYNLGNIFTKQSKTDEAIAAYKRASEIDPNLFMSQHSKNQAISERKHKAMPPQQEAETIKNVLKSEAHKYFIEPFIPHQEGDNCYMVEKGQDLTGETCELGLPVPPQDIWFGPHGHDVNRYLRSGKEVVDKMLAILKKAGVSKLENSKILEFGCAEGRLIRWLKPFYFDNEIWGVDIVSSRIIWCQRNLGEYFQFATNTIFPHLPFEDRYFDLIYAGSVFTHIDDLADTWMLELRRILKPNALLYVTIADKHSLELHVNSKNARVERVFSRYPEGKELSQVDFGKLVLGRSQRSQIYYDVEEFCKRLNRFFNVISINEEAYMTQTGVLLQKK
jgi:tetratricopeptide (TPR) repeat protein/SAM-dependent methyltransferase